MIGGYTVFVPVEWVQPINMSVEEAMRSSLIAWMARPPAGAADAGGCSLNISARLCPLSPKSFKANINVATGPALCRNACPMSA